MRKSNLAQKLAALVLSIIIVMNVASISAAAETGTPPDIGGETPGFEALGEALAQPSAAAGALLGDASSHLGEIGLYPYPDSVIPRSWKAMTGELLSTGTSAGLFGLIGNRFGGDGVTSFKLPDLREYTPYYDPASPLKMQYLIAAAADAIGRDPAISEVRLFPYDAQAAMPSIWRRCDGSLLVISDSEATQTLFEFIGSTYGGDGAYDFALPDLRALEPAGMGYYISLHINARIADAYLGEMILLAGDPNPTMRTNILPCDGRLLAPTSNMPLFSLLGTSFGGNGHTTFAIPNTCAAGSPSDLMNPLPDLEYYIVTTGTFPS